MTISRRTALSAFSMGSGLASTSMLGAAGSIGVLATNFATPATLSAQDQSRLADPLGKEIKFLTTNPARNGEPQLTDLVQNWMTPTKHFYVRSHAPNPVIDPKSFRLRIEGMVRKPSTFSLEEIQSSFSSKTVTATLTCAGNRRAEFNEEGKVGGVQWGPGAIGNATWTGALLSELLQKVELLEGAKHIWFEGLDQIEKGDKVIPFGGSIPVAKAMATGDVPGALLTYLMNGKPLEPDHGYPLRTVVPGYIGARSVKWLGKIVVSDRPSPNHYLATAYKIVRKTDAIDWLESGPIYRFPINGAIAPLSMDLKGNQNINVTGYVLPSGVSGNKIKFAQVSADGGKTWSKVNLIGNESDYCWRLWKTSVKISADTKRLFFRAGDSNGDFMPYKVRWNAKGYLQNSWYELPLQSN